MSLNMKMEFGHNHHHLNENNSSSYSNMNDENSSDEMMNETTNGSTSTSLKRKRLCDIAYTAEITFENQQAATQYVDSMCLWKFERNRATKKGSKGFYHCKMSDNCKSKIYLLSDPFSPKVVLYQNNIEHEHDPNAPPPSAAYLESLAAASAAKKSRMSLGGGGALVAANNFANDNNNGQVDIVNENDFEDSFVDFFDNDNDNDNEQNENEFNENGWPEDDNDNDNINHNHNNNNTTTNLDYTNGVIGSANQSSVMLNDTFMNYNLEQRFDTRLEANEYLETVYAGLWKFERTRPTKTGAKCFYKCKVSKDCKAKCYILSRPNVDECVLYKNNIEHDHMKINGGSVVNGSPMKKSVNTVADSSRLGADKSMSKMDDAGNKNFENGHGEETFEFGPINCESDDENTNDFDDDGDDLAITTNDNDDTNGGNVSQSTRLKRRAAANMVNRIELTYTPEESFENRRLANEFIDSLSIWKFQRTRSTKKGAKCFYVCKLSENCKSKIYVLSHPDSESVTVFRNNIEHDHTSPTSPTKKNVALNGETTGEILQTDNVNANQNDEDDDGAYENNFFNNTENNEDDNEASFANKSKMSVTGVRFEFNYSPEETFANRHEASQFIDSLGLWKFERNRPTKKGSKGFYHCKVSDNCKSKIYLLSQPNCEQVTLYRNNIEHDHTSSGTPVPPTTINTTTNGTSQNSSQTRTINKITVKPPPPSSHSQHQLRENQNSVNYQQDIGPLKYFINNHHHNNHQQDEDDENDEENIYDASEENNMNQSLDGSENFFSNNNNNMKMNNHMNGDMHYYDEDDEEEESDMNGGGGGGGRRSVTGANLNRFELVYTTDKTFDNRQLANEYIRELGLWKFQRTRCTKKGAKCFYMCKISKFCKSKMYVLTQPNSEKVILYINNIEHDHSISNNNFSSQKQNGFNNSNNNNRFLNKTSNDNDSDMIENDLFNENPGSNEFFPNSNHINNHNEIMLDGDEENFFSDDDNKSKTSSTLSGSSGASNYVADETFENKQVANSYVDSLGTWKFDRLRDTKFGAKGFYQCKLSEYCKSRIYLLFHVDSEKVTLYKNNMEHDHVKKSGLKKWGLSPLTKKIIDEVYLNGNTTPMSCMLKLRAIIKAKMDKINLEKTRGNDVTGLQMELEQIEEPEMTVLKNYINNTLKPKLNGHRDGFSAENGETIIEDVARLQKQNAELSQRLSNLEQLNKKLQDDLNTEREQKKDILNQLEIANNTIENLKLPNDSLIDLNESKEIQLKKQRTTIELLQKRIDELTAKKENSLNNQNNISSKIEKLICDNEVREYF